MKRLRFSRDVWLLIALVLALAFFTGFIALRQQEIDQQQQNFTSYSSHSAQVDGTRALHDWLARLGYRVERIENRAFQISDGTRLLFVLGPISEIERNEAEYILQWVARGNTLVVADERSFRTNGLFRALDVDLKGLDKRASTATLAQPLFDAASDEIALGTFNAMDFARADFVAYSQAEGKPLIARLKHEQGSVWLLSSPDIFTNENLQDADNAKFAAALVSDLPRGAVIAFDEYHLGFQPAESEGVIPLLYNTPWGWGVLFSFVLIFAYLALSGQRFGRVLPLPKTIARRSPSEYVTSMANLFRRANKRGMVLQHYRHSLKRRLGRPFHLNPELADERYIEMLARLRPELERNELVKILNSLRRTDTTEADLVRTIEQAVTFGGRASNK